MENKHTNHNENKHNKNNNSRFGFSTASLILGILGFFLGYLTLGIPLSLLGLIFGIVGIVKKQGGLAIGGTVISCIGILLSLFFIIFFNGDPYYFINQLITKKIF
ncbi:hypothetical protein AZF37_07135 [endosymbiont 'TC1' of Trimyema compressum]|uniref:DUF4190 domain-containing protein n=1 Tax=endosymbiont 'TC1' of Trimyema compressum TaxID=243899 RepID=UPI0007F0B054|nr:DUF4190 domain-containing protein [endosymbiont 'TC1' of Trimyema compressum]AMP20964.1 hypothetical protein AZF37_07135 [endosymbiont 'TC1' of Trimyema compressum]